MSAATQVYYASFDAVFLKLPFAIRARVEARIDENRFDARLLSASPIQGIESLPRSGWRLSDHLSFEIAQNKIHLLAIGHRREIYRI